MTQQLKKSVERIRELSPQLNAATDDANRVVAAVEQFLNEDCKVGIPAGVVAVYAAEDSQDAAMTLGYWRVQGKYRIAVGFNENVEGTIRQYLGEIRLRGARPDRTPVK